MEKLKRGKFSSQEEQVIVASYTSVSVEDLAKLLNRSEKSIRKFIDNHKTLPIPLAEKDPTSIPDPPAPRPRGHAKKYFQSPDPKKPGEFRRGFSILTEAGSQAGDLFLKEDISNLLPMSSKHQNCITKAQND